MPANGGSKARTPLTLSTVLLLAAWCGLLTGLGETSLRIAARLVIPEIIYFDPQMVWMAPLANAAIFGVVALALALLASTLRRRVWFAVAIFTFSFLGFLSWVTAVPRVHWLALTLIAAGLATQSTRLLARNPVRFLGFVRRSAIPIVFLVGLLGGGLNGWRAWREHRAFMGLPEASKGSPNVLLIILDTVRAASLSLYGYDRPTSPRLAQFARRGVLFQHAISAAPWTLPSHASIFTGHWPHELGADWKKPLDATYPTLAEELAMHGYATAGFAANRFYTTHETGLNRGFVHYEDYTVSPGQSVQSCYLGRLLIETYEKVFKTVFIPHRKTAAAVNAAFLRWLPHRPPRPFFAFINIFDAHDPYLSPGRFSRAFQTTTLSPRRLRQARYTAEEIRYYHDAYDASIAYIDDELGRLLDSLDRGRLLDSTLVIITSDHGDQFGEHGFMGHGSSLYLPELHVPLLISMPGLVPTAVTVKEPASLRDLAATIVDLVGAGGGSRLPGQSLAALWKGTPTANGPPLLSEVNVPPGLADWYPLVKGDMKSVIVGDRHYIRNGDGREELYDFQEDPVEQQDLAGDDHPGVERLRHSLDSILQSPSPDQASVRGRRGS